MNTPIEPVLGLAPNAGRSKLLIDMVNCLDVADDHLRVSAQRQGLVSRFFDSLTGAGSRRQAAIAQHQQTSLRAVVSVTNQLVRDLADNCHALEMTAQRLTHVEHALAEVAHAVADERAALQELRSSTQQQLAQVQTHLQRLDMRLAAHQHLTQLFDRWQAGKFDALAPATRIYVLMEDLYWGHFGEYLRRNPDDLHASNLLSQMQDKTMAQIRAETGLKFDDAMRLQNWLMLPAPQTPADESLHECVAWLGSHTDAQASQPIAYLCTQWPVLPAPPALPRTVSLIPSVKRMTEMVQQAVFDMPRVAT